MNKLKDRYIYDPKKDILGRGGFSTVYRAYDLQEKKFVALKFYFGDLGNKYDLEAEFKIAQRLAHPNLIQMNDVIILEKEGIHGNKVKNQIGVYEYADLGHLQAFIKKNRGKVPAPLIDHLVFDILKGLEHIHQNKIIHRDLKPQNILIKQEGDHIIAKITDFGISKALDQAAASGHSSQLLGSIEYMAPEQFNTKEYGHNGELGTNLDIWSFGVILTELINGRPIFGKRSDQTSVEQIMNKILTSPLPPPQVLRMKKPYSGILRKCLVRQAKDRIQEVSALIPMLESTLVQPRPDGTFQPFLEPTAPPEITPEPNVEEERKTQIIIRKPAPKKPIELSSATEIKPVPKPTPPPKPKPDESATSFQKPVEQPKPATQTTGNKPESSPAKTKVEDQKTIHENKPKPKRPKISIPAYDKGPDQDKLPPKRKLNIYLIIPFLLVLLGGGGFGGYRVWQNTQIDGLIDKGWKAFNAGEFDVSYDQFSTASRYGSPEGAYVTSKMKLLALGTEADHRGAYRQTRWAIRKGFDMGYYNLGYIYEKGLGEIADPVNAQKYYGLALEHTKLLIDTENHPEANYIYGKLLQEGYYLDDKNERYAPYFDAAASAGHPEGMTALGRCYYFGDELDKDQDKGKSWLFQSGEVEEPLAAYSLAIIYQVQENNLDSALYWYKIAADQASPEGLYWMGNSYFEGLNGLPKNPEEGEDLLRFSAEQGFDLAQVKMAKIMEAKGNEKNAFFWWKKAGEQRNGEAAYQTGVRYEKGNGVEKDTSQAYRFFDYSAQANYVEGLYRFGMIHLYRYMDQSNPETGVSLLRKAAKKEHRGAQYRLGLAFERGLGTPAKIDSANYYFKEAANAGYTLAQHHYGVLLFEGRRGFSRNTSVGINYLNRSAQQEYARSMTNLGIIYLEGKNGITQNLTLAADWFEKAKNSADPEGTFLLGTMYEKGQYFDKNMRTAKSLYRKAQKLGNNEAAKALKRLGE